MELTERDQNNFAKIDEMVTWYRLGGYMGRPDRSE